MLQGVSTVRCYVIVILCLFVGLPLGLIKDLRNVSQASAVCMSFYAAFSVYVSVFVSDYCYFTVTCMILMPVSSLVKITWKRFGVLLVVLSNYGPAGSAGVWTCINFGGLCLAGRMFVLLPFAWSCSYFLFLNVVCCRHGCCLSSQSVLCQLFPFSVIDVSLCELARQLVLEVSGKGP